MKLTVVTQLRNTNQPLYKSSVFQSFFGSRYHMGQIWRHPFLVKNNNMWHPLCSITKIKPVNTKFGVTPVGNHCTSQDMSEAGPDLRSRAFYQFYQNVEHDKFRATWNLTKDEKIKTNRKSWAARDSSMLPLKNTEKLS